MRKFLQKIRKIETINRVVRSVLKAFPSKGSGLINQLQKRWPVYGIVDCKFKDIKFKMFNQCDDGLVHFFYYNDKYHEEPDLWLFKELAAVSACMLDIGANTGLYSIISSIQNPKLDIHAFEPYPINATRLKTNLDINGLKNVNVRLEAVGEQTGNLEMSVPDNHSITSVSSMNKEFSKEVNPELTWTTIHVPVNTVDNFRATLARPIDLVKCDVETFEMSVFKGAYKTLETDKPAIVFESFLNEERRVFFNDILKKFGYHLYLIHENGIAYQKNGFSGNLGLNFLIAGIPPERDFIAFDEIERIRKSVLMRVHGPPSTVHGS